MRIEAVVFDIGNVLIEWRPERYFDRRIGPERRARMAAEVDLNAMMDRIDAGADFADTVARTARAHPDWHDEILHFRDRWCDIARPEITRSVRILRALRARGVPVFALSNFGAQNFPLSEAQFPFLAEFDRPDNIATARGRGWRTHLFDGPEGWAQCLIDAGLLSRKEAQ
jgi:2-haloacid dehalogenase